MSNAKASALATPNPGFYFAGRFADLFLVGGLSIIIFGLLKTLSVEGRPDSFISAAIFFSWIINWPHFAATILRLYQSSSHIKQYPLTSYAIPVLVIGAVIGSFLSPNSFASYFVKIYTLWSPFHFSGQTFGFTMVYARRCQVAISQFERNLLSGFIFLTFLKPSIAAETSSGFNDYFGVRYQMFNVPGWSVELVGSVMLALGVLLGAIFFYRAFVKKEKIPLIFFVPVVAQFVWFVWASGYPPFQEFVPLFHSLQYLIIAWSVQLGSAFIGKQKNVERKIRLVESLKWYAKIFVVGAVLFHFLPMLTSLVTGAGLNFCTAIILTGVQVHHFFVDGVIWKLRRGSAI